MFSTVAHCWYVLVTFHTTESNGHDQEYALHVLNRFDRYPFQEIIFDLLTQLAGSHKITKLVRHLHSTLNVTSIPVLSLPQICTTSKDQREHLWTIAGHSLGGTCHCVSSSSSCSKRRIRAWSSARDPDDPSLHTFL